MSCDSVRRQKAFDGCAEIRHVRCLPFAFGVWARKSLTRVGVFDHLRFIPDKTSRVEFILDMPVPRCRLPLIVEAFHERPRGGDTFSLLRSCVISRGVLPSTYSSKNTSDDSRFSFDDYPLALFAGGKGVTIGLSACIETLADTAGKTLRTL
jgi:hypothetical protein